MEKLLSDLLDLHPAAARLPLAQRSRYGLHLQRAGRQRLALLSAAPLHYYQAASRSWHLLDTQLRRRADGSLGAADLPFQLELDGSVAVQAAAGGLQHRHKAWRVGYFAAGRFHELQRMGPGQLHGAQLRRQAGPFAHHITLLPSGLREELLVPELPPAPAEKDALLVIESLLTAGSPLLAAPGLARAQPLHFPPGWAQDAAGLRHPLTRWLQEDKGGPRLYSGVPYAWLQNARFPVVLDPDIDISGDAADGTVWGSSPATSVGQTAFGETITTGGATSSGSPIVWRSYLKFDTASLGYGAEVEQANLTLYVTTRLNYVPWNIYVRQYNWSANDPFAPATREAAWDGLFATPNAALMASSTHPAGSHVTSADLPVDWVQVEGSTYYGLWCTQEGYSYPNNQGGRHDYGSAEHSNPLLRPLLALEYQAGYPRSGPVPLRARLLAPRLRLADARRKLSARARRTAFTARLGRG